MLLVNKTDKSIIRIGTIILETLTLVKSSTKTHNMSITLTFGINKYLLKNQL